jgi:Phytochelatin synthase
MNLNQRGITQALRLPLSAVMVSLWLTSSELRTQALPTQALPLGANLIDFNSTAGEQLLTESAAKRDYFPLSSQFVTQDNLAYCGVASMVMVLNALAIPAPAAPEYRNTRFFTQTNFFANPKTQAVMTAAMVARGGMTLDQLGRLLESYPVQATVYYGSAVSLNEFRQLWIENLQQPHNFVIVNYLRSAMGEAGGGHISPIAAYHQPSDRFLVLDVSRYKYPPVWVKAEQLWQAMKTIDTASKKTRGFVLVRPKSS